MKNLLILFFLLAMIGCESPRAQKERQAEENPQLVFNEILLSHGVYRLENAEVLCYYRYDTAMQCQFKGER